MEPNNIASDWLFNNFHKLYPKKQIKVNRKISKREKVVFLHKIVLLEKSYY